MAAAWPCIVKESVRSGLLEIIQKLNVGNLQYHEADYIYIINWLDWKQPCVSMRNLQTSMTVCSAVFNFRGEVSDEE